MGVRTASRRISPPARRSSADCGRWLQPPAEEELRGALRDRAHARAPPLAGARLRGPVVHRPLRRDHEPQLPRRRRARRLAVRAATRGQRHASPRHQPGGGARGHCCGRWRRRWAGGRRVHPPRGLPRHAVHRGLADPRGGHAHARSPSGGRRDPAADPRWARRSPACSCRSGSSRRTGRWRCRGA